MLVRSSSYSLPKKTSFLKYLLIYACVLCICSRAGPFMPSKSKPNFLCKHQLCISSLFSIPYSQCGITMVAWISPAGSIYIMEIDTPYNSECIIFPRSSIPLPRGCHLCYSVYSILILWWAKARIWLYGWSGLEYLYLLLIELVLV